MKIKKLFSMLLVLAVVFCGALPAFAAVPERPANRYVLDSANVLSDETEKKIISQNEKLFRETGAEIVVVSVDFIDGNDSEEYTYDIFKAWGVGSKERNNGLLLMFAIGENKVWAMPGYGIENYFTVSVLDDIFHDSFDADYDNRQYDAAVNGFFDDAYRRMETYYQNYTDEYTQQQSAAYTSGGGPRQGNSSGASGSNSRSWFGGIIAVVVIVVLISVLSSFGCRGGGGGYGGYGGGGGGFWSGMFLGSMFGGRRRHRHHHHHGPPPGGFGGFGGGGGFGGFGGGGGSGGGGSGRGGGFGGGGGGFSGGGGSRGGGSGRR